MSGTTHLQARHQMACIAGGTLFAISFVALTGLVTLFATSTLHDTPIYPTALAAAILDLLSIATPIAFAITHCATNGSISGTPARSTAVMAAMTLLTGSGLLLSIIVLGWMRPRLALLEYVHHSKGVSKLFGAAIAMWIVSLLLEIACFIFWANRASPPDAPVCVYSTEYSTKEGVPCVVAKSMAPRLPYSWCLSPTTQATAVSPLSSFRTSMVSLLRPMTSKSSLSVLPKEPYNKDMASIKLEIPAEPVRKEDGFELWDVSTPQSPQDTLSSGKSHKGQVLETIPGSRSTSPANALDGHFQMEKTSPADVPLPPSPPRKIPKMPSRLQLDATMTKLDPLLPPAHFIPSRPSSPTLGTSSPTRSFISSHAPVPSSPRGSPKSHIHPLFRSESPMPSPLGTSHSTNFTSVPWAGNLTPSFSEHSLAQPRRRSLGGSSGGSELAAHQEPHSAWKSKSQTDLSATYARDKMSLPERSSPLKSTFFS